MTVKSDPLWYPYTQHQTMSAPLTITHATGATLYTETTGPLIDAISSWWCMIHGYNHPSLNRAITDQLSRMAHVMMGGLTHAPAQELAQKLVEITPEPLQHVFFSDSGSVGMEVAMKMALQFWKNTQHPQKTKFVALKKAYHGDTCGVLSIGDPEDGMHADFASAFPKQFFVSSPTSGYHPNLAQLDSEMAEIEALFHTHHHEIAAFVVEPLMQGAGGFNFYSPDYLNRAGELCKRYNILFIFDEVATGFGRTGTLFAVTQTQVCPDILVLGKALTGGYIGQAATLTTSQIFNAFYAPSEDKAFMHGPTFMGNPLACAVSLESIRIFESENYIDKISKITRQLNAELSPIRSNKIKEIRVLGGVGVIEVIDKKDLETISEFAIQNGVWLRPFGTVVYTTPPYTITSAELSQITSVLNRFFS